MFLNLFSKKQMSMGLYNGKTDSCEWSMCLDLNLPVGVVASIGRARKYRGAFHKSSMLVKRSVFCVRDEPERKRPKAWLATMLIIMQK